MILINELLVLHWLHDCDFRILFKISICFRYWIGTICRCIRLFNFNKISFVFCVSNNRQMILKDSFIEEIHVKI